MTAEKTTSPTTVQHHAPSGTFFRKAEDGGFFGNHEPTSFFGGGFIQPKLTVSQPDDPQEREADAMADHVMRMPEPSAAPSGAASQEDGDTIHRFPDPVDMPIMAPREDERSKLSRMEDEGNRSGESAVQAMLMRKCSACEQEEKAQAKLMRQSDGEQEHGENLATGINRKAWTSYIQPKSHGPPGSAFVQRSGRAPPAPNTSFESTLQSTKGGGSVLPGETRQFMEHRFGADFSGVRIHTGAQAEGLSSGIHAHAFTHGGDIYFNSGRYAPETSSGSHLLAHELTHTIQQGASRPVQSSGGTIAPKIQRTPSRLQRSAVARPVPSQLTNAVAKAKAEEGKVNANKEGADGNRMGWEHLVDYFKTTLGEDKVIPAGGTGAQGAVAEADIKKKREIDGPVPAHPKREKGGPYMRDAMPSWCGIFVFWALHKAGVPMKPWALGGRAVKPEAAYPPGYTPQAGDIAYRNDYSHFAIVEKASGDTITTVNGNTAGEDNLGGQVQTRDHPRSGWTAFFDPLMLKDGPLSSGETSAEAVRPLGVDELRKKLFGVDRKAEEEPGHHEGEPTPVNESATETVQTKPELSSWAVNATGALQRHEAATGEEEKLQKKEDEKKEEDKLGGQAKPLIQKKECSCCNESDASASLSGPEDAASPETSSISRQLDSAAPQPVSVTTHQPASRGPPGQIQRSWLGDAWDAVGDAVNSAVEWAEDQINEAKEWILEQISDFVSNIPGFRMLTVILERNPITNARVVRNGATMLSAGLQILGPLGGIIETLLRRTNTFTDAANFVESRVDDFIGMASSIGSRFSTFLDGLSVTDIGHPQQVLDDVANLLHGVISDIAGFIERTTSDFLEMIKRIMIREVAGFIRTRIPRLYPLLRVALGHDPVTNEDVPRNGANILNALFDVTDAGREQRARLQETGTFQRVADWIDRGISVFSNLYTAIRTGFSLIWDAVSFDTLLHPIETFERIYNHFAQPIADVWAFVRDTAAIIIQFIKEALLSRLSAWAREQRGYFLITLLIHRDPFTNQSVPFTVENVIHAFMSLMEGGEEQFQQMKQSGAIERTTNRITAAVRRLNFTVEYIVSLFTGLWSRVQLSDFANPFALFRRVIETFAQPVRRLIAFVIEIIKIIVEVILQIMQFPVDLVSNIINRAMAAWERIKRDPIGFLKNILRAIKQGFIQFFDHILDHLLYGLTGWLMAELRDAGVPELTDFSLRGVISWVLQVLGISMEAIWAKLAAHPRIGPQRVARLRQVISYAEGIWTFIKDVQERGIQAVWEKIQEQLSNLWDTVLSAVREWVMREIIGNITARLLSMLDPTGIMAVINSAIAIYRAIQSFIRYLRQMLEVVNSFVEGVAQIAEGNVTMAANFLEGAMHRAMPVVIGFLANQVGLSGIGSRVAELIGRARELVDQALTWLVNRAVDTAFALFERLLAMGRSAVSAVSNWLQGLLGLRKPFTTRDGRTHSLYFEPRGNGAALIVASTPKTLEQLITDRRTQIQQENTATPTKVTENGPKLSALARAEVLKGEVNGLLPQYNDAVDRASDRQANALRGDIERRMLGILEQLITAGVETDGSNNVTTRVEHTAGAGGRPMRVVAEPLTTIPGNTAGSTPQEEPLGKSFVTPSVWTSHWVAAHLLNHHLHGPGVQWNLVAGTKETNNNMKTEIENTAKDEVLGNPTKQYYYEVNVSYYGAQPAKPFMADFPFQVNVQFGELTGTPGAFSRGPARGRSFTQDSPDLTNTVMPAINESSASRLKAASDAAGKGIPASVFERMVEARRTRPGQSLGNSAPEVIAAMDAHYVAQGYAATGAFTTRYGADITALTSTHIFIHY